MSCLRQKGIVVILDRQLFSVASLWESGIFKNNSIIYAAGSLGHLTIGTLLYLYFTYFLFSVDTLIISYIKHHRFLIVCPHNFPFKEIFLCQVYS